MIGQKHWHRFLTQSDVKLKTIIPRINRMREMASFELGKEMEKEVFHLVTSVRQRKF